MKGFKVAVLTGVMFFLCAGFTVSLSHVEGYDREMMLVWTVTFCIFATASLALSIPLYVIDRFLQMTSKMSDEELNQVIE